MKKKRRNIVILILALLVILILFFCVRCLQLPGQPNNTGSLGSGGGSTNEPIVFADPIFEKLLKAELGKEQIFPSDLTDYSGVRIAADKFLFLSGKGRPNKSIILFHEDTFEYEGQKYTGFGTIKTLEDLKYFTSLTALYVTLQPEIDYSTIPVLDKLNHLNITQSKLNNIDFLENAKSLITISFSTNSITDISSLAKCTELKKISIGYNKVSDISPLAGLSKLEDFSCYDNEISDISPLAGLNNLEEIGFYSNNIIDISVLKELKNLKSVELINNRIEDVSPLKDFASFERLALTGNPVKNINLLSHISNLEY